MSFRPTIKFCCQCGSPVKHAIPDDGDTRVRAICPPAALCTIKTR